MAINREQVQQIAQLALIGLTAAEIEAFTAQLNEVLVGLQPLFELKTDAIAPTAQVLPLRNVFRADTVQESLPSEVALANAAVTAAGSFRVPRITDV